MKKLVIVTAIIIVLALAIAAFFIFQKNDLEDAIDEFDHGDYIDAIVSMNRLIPLSDYETAEKIYYYRARAINKLAYRLEDEYRDELAQAALENKGKADFDTTKREISNELKSINARIKGDLSLSLQRKKSRIAPGGAFYSEFASKYRGSGFIEDLDFEEIEQLEKTDQNLHLNALIGFYQKYPNTGYISHIVRILFDGMQGGRISFGTDKREAFWGIITSYVRRYPTSPVTGKLFVSTGDNVNLRNSPGIQGERVGQLKKGDILVQLEKSMDSQQIGDVRDHWYRVSSLSGVKGWIFGKFLSPLDVSTLKEEKTEERWALDERFDECSDSNTPKNWMHVDGSEKSCVSFRIDRGRKIVALDSPKGKITGLYTRYGSSRAFTVSAKARYIGGESAIIIGYALDGNSAFSIRLKDEECVVSGRSMPVHTSDWHEYTLSSQDGKFASLSIDGEIVSSRITPVKFPGFANRGVYCLYSSEKESSQAEMEFIRIR